jgi:hypothetical protein
MGREASPAGAGVPLVYVETTIPCGMTIDEYRRLRPHRSGRWQRLRRRVRGARAA